MEKVCVGSTVDIAGTQPGVIYSSDRPKKRGVSATFFNLLHSMKRGTHGIAVVSIVVTGAAIRIETECNPGIVVTAGTQPGVIYASDSPESAGYPRLFLIYCIR